MRRAVPALARTRSDLQGLVLPPVSNGVPAMLAALLRQLDDSQWLSPAEIAARQFHQLAVLADHCARHSPQFRRRLDDAGLTADDICNAEGLLRLPLLRRRDLQSDPGLDCDEIPPGHAPRNRTRTSGSTGEPVEVRRTAVSNFDWYGLALREHLWHGRDFSKPICSLLASVAQPVREADWGRPTSLLFDTGPSLLIPLDAPISRMVELIAAFAPETLVVYPTVLEALVEEAAAGRAALPSIRHIRTKSETLTPELRRRAAQAFGARVADAYSSEEVGAIACDCPDALFYHVMETVIVEILDEAGAPCAPGQSGRVVVTDLRNFATPLIRYDIGDYAQAGPPCPCGRGLPTLTRILGRERNLVMMPDGSRHWPMFGGRDFRDLAPVRQSQIIQHDRDKLEIRLVTETALSGAQEDALRERVRKIVGYPFRIEFTYFEGALPRGPNGKFDEFICRVTA